MEEVKQIAFKRKNRKKNLKKQKKRMLVTKNHQKIAKQIIRQGKNRGRKNKQTKNAECSNSKSKWK